MAATSWSNWVHVVLTVLTLKMGKKNKPSWQSTSAIRGQKAAFVGATLAGKTTITNFDQPLLWYPTGMITYDGIDIKLIEKDFCAVPRIVLQDTHLFTGTIGENIAYGRTDATREETSKQPIAGTIPLLLILDQAMIYSLTRMMGLAYQMVNDTDRHCPAAFKQCACLDSDEATSSIDSRTEKMVKDGSPDGRSDSLVIASPSVDDCQFRCHHGDGPRTRYRTRQPCFLDGRTWHLLPLRTPVDLKLIINKKLER